MNNTAKPTKHLMLDLDETLICSSPMYTTLPKINVLVKHQGRVIFNLPKLVMRPYLIEFLTAMQAHYNLHLFTAAEEFYAEAILDRLGVRHMFLDVYARSTCTNFFGAHIKNLCSLPYPPSDTLLIDDLAYQVLNQPDQAILIRPFFGNPDDEELKKLIPFLTELSKCQDIRPVSWKHMRFNETGEIPKNPNTQPLLRKGSEKNIQRKNSLQRKNSSKKRDSRSKGKANPEESKKSYFRSSTVNQKALLSKAKQVPVPEEKGPKKVHNNEWVLTAPIKMKLAGLADLRVTVKTTEPKSINSVSSSEDCNLNSDDDEMLAPSENPTVTRHLGPQAHKLPQLCQT